MTDTLDRLQGARSTLGMKTPVRVATTANITLSGLQAIDGITVAEDDRVLVKDQTASEDNGVYAASTGEWSRTKDFDGAGDFVRGTTVVAAQGTLNVGRVYRVSSAAIATIGEDDIEFTAIDFDSDENGSAISATTLNLDAVEGEVVDVSGAATITAITLTEAVTKMVRFTGAATLTHSASLVLPGSQSIVCDAGDWAIFRGYASSVVRCAFFQRGSSSHPLVTGAATIASAATTDLGSVREQTITISGSTPITSLGTSAPTGAVKFCRLSGAILLTNGANLVLPNGVNVQGASGDSFIARYEGSSVWRVLNYSRVTNSYTSTLDASTTTAETDLASHTVPASRIASSGDFIKASAWGTITTATTAATRRVRIYFDGQICADSTALAQTGGVWKINTTIVTQAAASVETYGEYIGSTGGTAYITPSRLFISTTLGSSIELKVTGLCTGSSGIITLTGFTVEYGSR
jgi:hypothetical protein